MLHMKYMDYKSNQYLPITACTEPITNTYTVENEVGPTLFPFLFCVAHSKQLT